MRRIYKWIAFALAFLLFLILGSKTVPLADRAVVMGIGIDKIENGYKVTAQIIMPTDSESKSAGYIVLSSDGESVSEALMSVSIEAGRQLSVSHCNAVVLGFEVIQHDAVNALDYMVRNAYLSENALIVAAANTAEEVLNAKPAFAEMSSLYLQTMLTKYGDYSIRSGRNIKEFLVSYNTRSKGNWLSLTTVTETAGEVSGEQSAEEPEFIFSFDDTAVFKGGDYVTKLDERGTRGINYVEKHIKEGSIVAVCDGKIYTYFIENMKTQKKFSDDYSAAFSTRATLILKEIQSDDGTTSNANSIDSERNPGIKAAVAKVIADDIRYAYEESKKFGVDIFGLGEGFYGATGKNFDPVGYFDRAVLEIEVKVDFV